MNISLDYINSVIIISTYIHFVTVSENMFQVLSCVLLFMYAVYEVKVEGQSFLTILWYVPLVFFHQYLC